MSDIASALGGIGKLARGFLGEDFFNEISGTIQNKKSNFPVNLYNLEKEIIVCIAISGISDINKLKFKLLEDNQLCIKGKTSLLHPQDKLMQQEIKEGDFEEIVALKCEVKKPQTLLKYEKGILEIHFDKK